MRVVLTKTKLLKMFIDW